MAPPLIKAIFPKTGAIGPEPSSPGFTRLELDAYTGIGYNNEGNVLKMTMEANASDFAGTGFKGGRGRMYGTKSS